jgi:hypothetical protein
MKITKGQLVRVYRAIRNLGDVYPNDWYNAWAFAEWVDAHGVDATVARLRELYGVHRIVVTGSPDARTILYAPRGRDLHFYLAFDYDGTVRVRYHDAYIVARDGVAQVECESFPHYTGIALKILLAATGERFELRIRANEQRMLTIAEILSRPIEEVMRPPNSWAYYDPVGWSVENWHWLHRFIPLMGERVAEASDAKTHIDWIRTDGTYLYYPADEQNWYRVRYTAIYRLMYALGIPSDYEKSCGRRDYPFRPSNE